MIAKDHNKLLGWLFLGLGGLELVSNLFSILYIPLSFEQTLADVRRMNGGVPWWLENLSFYLVIFVVVVTVVMTIPKLIAAFAILKEKSWGRGIGIVAGGLSLLGIPVGTALGIYAIWFMTSDKGKAFYAGEAGRDVSPPPPADR